MRVLQKVVVAGTLLTERGDPNIPKSRQAVTFMERRFRLAHDV